MAWARLDDQCNGSAKVLALSDAAFRMWAGALVYCQANLTDGFVPEHAIHTFGVRAPNKKNIADELCRSLVPGKGPCWHRAEGGFQIHEYLEWNNSKEEILHDREKSKTRLKEWRNQRRNGVSNTVSNTVSNGVRNALRTPHETGSERDSTPTPTPTPTTTTPDKGVSSEPHAASKPVLVFPVVGVGGTEWSLTVQQVAEWRGLFPALDVLTEARHALAWVMANPGRRKTVKGMPAFLVNWFNRAVNHGGSNGNQRPAAASRRIAGGQTAPADKYAGIERHDE